MKKVVVTGSDGFIGTHLCAKLASLGYDLVKIDIRNENPANILDINLLKHLCKDADCIIHLAAISSVTKCSINPTEALNVNVLGTDNVIEVAKENNAQIIFSSSAAVYGRNPPAVHSPLHLLNVYAHSKALGERAITNSNLDYTILRIFNVFGDGGHGVINQFINSLETGLPIYMHNKFVIRDFIYVKDLVKEIVRSIRSPQRYGVFNVGSAVSTSLEQLPMYLDPFYKNASKNIVLLDVKQDLLWSTAVEEENLIKCRPLEESLKDFLND